MSHLQLPRPSTRRQPLGEITKRVNNTHQPQNASTPKESPVSQQGSLKPDRLLQVRNAVSGSPLTQRDYCPPGEFPRGGSSPNSSVANPRLSAISKEHPVTDSNRNSQISTVSTNASDGKRLKFCIGPWKLGKTLGKGATARVRLARHVYTGQEAAIKIVQKRNAQMSQAGSLAALDQAESKEQPDSKGGVRRMPIGVEREVAIMKLIQHPNIMKLYDIWENRTEIYLVLEYVDKGELFEHITASGKLGEEEAIKYFRQILSAVGYCHSFNICHRDLKPENILLTRGGDIKIADFGMAALHQSPDHKLKTSCGSPHYAAPELIKGSTYRGDKVDIWSMGVILYATLAGRLPFDVEGSGKDWIGPLLLKIRKGSYEMAPEFSSDAANLIWRILQVNPRDRINLDQIWKHPAVRKYDYLDDFGGGTNRLSPNVKSYGHPILRRSDISKDLVRHLRSLWHRLTEEQLMDALLSKGPNEQKLFYGLLVKYRDAQLEDYTPDMEYSASDYHHVRPLALTKTYSTRQFSQTNSKGHGRQTSRFTVISNVAETEQSYDPFKASRPQHLDSFRTTDNPRVTVHCSQASTNKAENIEVIKPLRLVRPSGSMAGGSDRGRHQKLAPPSRAFASRSSLASSTRSRNSAAYMRVPSRHKRGVDFSHVRRQSIGSQGKASVPSLELAERHNNREVGVLGPIQGSPDSSHYIRSRKRQATASQPLLSIPRPARTSQLWTDDVRQHSSNLAKDCDEAFNRSSVISTTSARRNSKTLSSFEPSQLAVANKPATPITTRPDPAAHNVIHTSLTNRPLPTPPTRTESVKIELMEARLQAENRKRQSGGDESPGYLDRMVSHIDRLIQPPSPLRIRRDHRVSSAPVENKHTASIRPLPSIYERHKEEDSPRRVANADELKDQYGRNESKVGRIASAPEPRTSTVYYDDRLARLEANIRDTIRVVNPSCPGSPADMPAPLTIRKKSSQGVGPAPPAPPSPPPGDARIGTGGSSYPVKQRQPGPEPQQAHRAISSLNGGSDLGRIDEGNIDDQSAAGSNSSTIVRKRSTWFKRNSKSEDERDWRMSIGGGHALPSQSSTADTAQHHPGAIPLPPKKKGFNLGRLFKKRSKTDMTVGGDDIFDGNESDEDSAIEAQRLSYLRRSKVEDRKPRQIEPQRNWLAKLFNVKPATKYICFSISKRKALQAIGGILKEWKRYGIRNVQVDKERNIVFARVAARNYLDLKEVSFAGEVMTVIEHGKRSQLSIARFTQERGAASSFLKVLETLETVLKSRGLLVADERRKRRMIKTLDSARSA